MWGALPNRPWHLDFILPYARSHLLAAIFSMQWPEGTGKGPPSSPAHPWGRRWGKLMVKCYSPPIPLR